MSNSNDPSELRLVTFQARFNLVGVNYLCIAQIIHLPFVANTFRYLVFAMPPSGSWWIIGVG